VPVVQVRLSARLLLRVRRLNTSSRLGERANFRRPIRYDFTPATPIVRVVELIIVYIYSGPTREFRVLDVISVV